MRLIQKEVINMHKLWRKYGIYCLNTLAYLTITLAGLICLSMLCGGCMTGHNVYREKEMTGIDLSIPLGQTFLGLQIGATKTVTAVIRGGVSFETTSANHGGLFSGAGGQSKITQMKTNTQLNEGYLAEVLCSTNVPDSVKQTLASNLVNASTAPYFPGSVLQTEGSTIHIGRNAILSNAVERIEATSKGLDRLVDKTATIIGSNVVSDAIGATGNIVHDITNPLQDTVEQLGDTVEDIGQTVTDASDQIKQILFSLIAVIIGTVLVIVIIGIIASKFKRKPKHIRIDADLEQVLVNEDGTPMQMPTDDKLSIDAIESVVASPPPTTNIDPVEQKVVTQPKSNRLKGWWTKLLSFLKTAAKLLNMIPPGVRQRIQDWIVKYWKKKQRTVKPKQKQ